MFTVKVGILGEYKSHDRSQDRRQITTNSSLSFYSILIVLTVRISIAVVPTHKACKTSVFGSTLCLSMLECNAYTFGHLCYQSGHHYRKDCTSF